MDYSIGQYRIGNEIGRGSFANVYKGVHIKTKTAVAIKSVLRAKLNKKLLENLESEIKILKTLSHPHIVALLDCQHSATYIHLVMEYCSLGDLSYFIKKRDKLSNIPLVASMISKFPNSPTGGLNEAVVRHFLKQLASSIQFLRDRNLIHRDVKPQNLLISPPPRTEQEFIDLKYAGRWGLPILKLADFGFARILPSTSLAETLCGSPLYMAPEILRYEKYDAKADLWSVGTVLYEMTMGKAPFRASNHVELLRKIEKGEDRIKFSEDVQVSEEMKRLIRGLLRRNPVERMGFKEFFEDEVVKGDIPEVFDVGNILEEMEEDKFIAEYLSKNTPPHLTTATAVPNAYDNVTMAQGDQGVVNANVSSPNTATTYAGTSAGSRISQQSSSIRRKPSLNYSRQPSTNQQEVPSTSASSSLNRLHHQPSNIRSCQASVGIPEDDVMFEREYVVVEKRTVEVNAFADELANSPKLVTPASARRYSSSSRSSPLSVSNPYRQMYSTSQGSYEQPRRFMYGASPTSTLAKALTMASTRLFGGGRPDSSSASPPFQQAQRPLKISNSRDVQVDERELSVIYRVEDLATKSDVIYQFAHVKFSQLLPSTPASDINLSSELTPDAVITLSEEALVLFVKSLSLLAKAMDIAAHWWSENELSGASSRLNNVVQWVRERFNEALEKAEFVRLKLADPTGRGIIYEGYMASGVTAEKLIYDRALEMSRAAAINELVGDDLPGCEMTYETSLWMLQSILEDDGSGEIIDEDDYRIVETFITSIKNRLTSLRKKIEMSTSLHSNSIYKSGVRAPIGI
ncbi:kinase-like domain-containing protein [Dipodascopsis uninucleata]